MMHYNISRIDPNIIHPAEAMVNMESKQTHYVEARIETSMHRPPMNSITGPEEDGGEHSRHSFLGRTFADDDGYNDPDTVEEQQVDGCLCR